jgi:hypothetical protein
LSRLILANHALSKVNESALALAREARETANKALQDARIREEMFWHALESEYKPRQLEPTAEDLILTFIPHMNLRIGLFQMAKNQIWVLRKQFGYGFKKGAVVEIEVNDNQVHALFGSGTQNNVERNTKKNLRRKKSPPLFDWSLLSIDFESPHCTLPDFLTIRTRFQLAYERACTRMSRRHSERVYYFGPPAILLEDCLYWTTEEGQEEMKVRISTASGFYNPSNSEPATNLPPTSTNNRLTPTHELSVASASENAASKNAASAPGPVPALTPTPDPKLAPKLAPKPAPKPARNAASKPAPKPARNAASKPPQTKPPLKPARNPGSKPPPTKPDPKPSPPQPHEESGSTSSNAAHSEDDGLSATPCDDEDDDDDSSSSSDDDGLLATPCEDEGDDDDCSSSCDESCSLDPNNIHKNEIKDTDHDHPFNPQDCSCIFGNENSNEYIKAKEVDEAMQLLYDELCSNRFRDEWIDVKAGASTTKEAGPVDPSLYTIDWYKVVIDGHHIHYFTFDNAISSARKQHIFQSANSNPYMSSEDVSMGANKAGSRYVRVSDEGGENEYFHLKSDNKRLLGTVSPCKEEKGCLTIMRYILEKMDDAMEKAAKGKKFPKHSVRQLQIVLGSLKGAAYASHNDGSPTLCNNVARHDSSPVVEPAAKRRATKRTVHPLSERRSSRSKIASTAVDKLPANQVHEPASMEENKDEKEDQQDEEQEDGDPDLEEAPDIPCLQTLLPSRYELRVPTITLANVGPGHTVAYFMITDPDDNPVTLFKYNPQTKKWVRQRKSSIPMSGNFIHLQCLQAQLRLKHNVVVALRGMAGLLRLVLSGRNPYHSALPHFEQLMRTANLLEAYEQRHRCYNFINVCSSLARNRRPDMVGCGVDVQKYDQPDRIFPTTKSLATFRTPKGMLPHDIVRYFMPVPIGYIQSNLPLDEVLLSGAFAKVFLKEGIQVTVKSSPDKKKQWTAHHGRMPYVDRIYKVGDKDGKYTSGVLATGDIFPVQDGLRAVNFDGNDKHRKHTWFTVHHSGITYIFCRQMYKCDYISADKLQELMKNGGEIPDGYEFYVDASGGSASMNGSVVVATENLPTGCWNIASGVLAQPQEFGTHYNHALLKLIKRGGLVVLACPARIMDMPWLDQKEILACGDSIHSDQYLQCFGMLQVTKGGYAEREPVYRTADLPRMSEDGQRTLITPSQMPYLTYRTETHIRLYLKRYDWCQPKPQSSTAPTSENRTITLEMKKGKSGWEVERCGNGRPRLGFLLDDKGEGEGELKTVDALTPGPMYQGMEELAKAFVKDGHITEYLSLEEDPASSQDSGGESDNRALRSGRKLSIARDLIYFYMHLSVAIAARALRMNVHGGKDVSILHQDMFVDSIGDVLRASPSPSFCRIADATTGLYLKMVENSLPRSHMPIMKPGWKRIDPNNGPLPPAPSTGC